MSYAEWFGAAGLMFGLGYVIGDRILWLRRIYELA